MNDLIRRQKATEATKKKYENKPFDWKAHNTCLHMARFHLKKMGHKPPKIPNIYSPVGAKRALKENGWSGLEEMLDSLLVRKSPAAMLLGDIALLEGTEGFGSIVISAGFKVFGWHDDAEGMVNMTPFEIEKAWHV